MKTSYTIAITAIITAVIAGGIAFVAMKPTGQDTTDNQSSAGRPYEGEHLHVTAWSGSWAETFKAGVVPPFEEKTGAEVEVTAGWSDLIPKSIAGAPDNPPWDVTICTETTIVRGIEENIFLPLRKQNIPNLEEFYDVFREGGAFSDELYKYGVAADGALEALIWNNEYLPEGVELDSFEDIFVNPDSSLKGKIGLEFSQWGLMELAIACQDEPGMQELYSEEGVDAVFDMLKDIKPYIGTFWQSGGEAFSALESGDIAITAYYQGSGSSWVLDSPNAGMTVPETSCISYWDFWAINRGTEHRRLAEEFLNYLASKKGQERILRYVGNFVARKDIDPRVANYILEPLVPQSAEEWNSIAFPKAGTIAEKWSSEWRDRFKEIMQS
ncbi:hypothetical protein AKJ49_00840 [candidate division MSBL1 archaeon SCGC-AAA382A03]|uniref:ABC transporter substrate-binding protein n=1 Tax=candidate division MSBL1 archaeon SCGC-AAA382A03 TaxID=1698278 RepID=A0A133VG62_9EURY|nr:hypothetical protein AKJ49_00840 [candidate division MSBL1 archaeon SCGC-AAA382A03]